MPGLYGIISTAQKPDPQVYSKLSDCITPFDSQSILCNNDTALLGFKSLGIIDLPKQPFHNSERDLYLFIWGEIYDYPERNKSVAEYIFDLYLNDKLDNLKELNGGYSLALWDNKKRKLILASDIYATRPLYYYQSNDNIVFASNPFAIAKVLALKKINQMALDQFLQYSLICGSNTWLMKIHKILPGSFRIFENGKSKNQHYFAPIFTEENISLSDSAAGIIDILSAVIDHYHDDKFALSLSGGGDSRLLAGLCKQAGYDFKAFTFCGEKSGDLDIARRVSRHLNLVHYPMLISPQFLPNNIHEAVYNTAGFSAAVNFHGISTRQEVRKLAGLALSGLYGNNFLGYMSFGMQKFSGISDWQKFELQLDTWLRSGFSDNEIKTILIDRSYFTTAHLLEHTLTERYRQKACLPTLMAIDHFEINSQRSLCGFWLYCKYPRATNY